MDLTTKKIAVIVLFSLAVNLLLMPLFLDPSHNNLPHFDGWEYVIEANCILDGGVLYSGRSIDEPCYSVHGPAFPLVMALALKSFGENYFLKLPAILLGTASVLVFFRLGKILFGSRASIFFTFAYAFSYLPIFLSGMTGNDDTLFMFFVLLGTLFLFRDNVLRSAASLGIAAAFKVSAFIFLPAFLIAVFSRSGLKKAIAFVIVFGTCLSAILLPFYYEAGDRIAGYLGNVAIMDMPPNFLSLFSILRLSHRVITYAIDPSVSNQDAFVHFLTSGVLPFFALAGILFAGFYVLSNRLEKTHMGFLRNAIMTVLFVLLTNSATVPDYVFWMYPFLLLFWGLVYKKRYRGGIILQQEYLGAILTVSGLFVFAYFFRFSWSQLTPNTYLLWLVFILCPLGAYLMFSRIPGKDRRLWAVLLLGLSMYGVIGANPFLVFKPMAEKVLPSSIATRDIVVVSESGGTVHSALLDDLVYLPYFFISIVLFVASAFMLALRVHYTSKINGGARSWSLDFEARRWKKIVRKLSSKVH